MIDVEIAQLKPFRVEKSTGLGLKINHGFAYTFSGWKAIEDGLIDLSGHVPETGARVVLVCLSASGSIDLVDGDIKTSRSALKPENIPPVPDHEIPVAAVALAAGQTELVIDSDKTDLADLRNFLLPPMGEFANSEHDHTLSSLTDVAISNPGNNQYLGWDQGSNRWVAKTPLAFQGLAKISVDDVEPTNPVAGDLWVDIS